MSFARLPNEGTTIIHKKNQKDERLKELKLYSVERRYIRVQDVARFCASPRDYVNSEPQNWDTIKWSKSLTLRPQAKSEKCVQIALRVNRPL